MLILFAVMPSWVIALIIVIAVAYSIGSLALQRKLANPKKMREIQARVKEHTKKLNEMVKGGASKEEIMAKNKEVMPLVMESTKHQMKPLIVILPIFLLLYDVLLPYMATSMGFSKSTVDFIFTMNYQYFFFAIVFIVGMISTVVVMLYDKKKTKEEQALLAQSV
ncbi:MAG: EMC3/TMCO1 family protein [Candidatus Micrarchaeaceae archaeon]